MYDKDYVQKVLKLNGLTPESADDDIKSVLLYAKCRDVDNAITALRDGSVGPHGDVCGLQHTSAQCNILLADKRLRPERVKELLGIDMNMSYDEIQDIRRSRSHISVWQACSIVGWSLVCAAGGVIGLMWYYGIGFFHPAA